MMSWQKKVIFASVVTVAFFVAMEGLLAILGVTPVTDTEDPFVGFSSQQPLMQRVTSGSGTQSIRTATNKLVWFNDQSFPAQKSPTTKRVFCVGGSTTYGHPYWDPTSYVGWLRELLPRVEPSTDWEVINAGGVSYASYRITVVMQELSQYEPDLFIVYCGQNEFLERRTYHDFFSEPHIKTDLHAALARTRIWALADRLIGNSGVEKSSPAKTILPGEVDEILNHTIGPVDYHRDETWKAGVVAHYELNLNRMVAIAEAAGARIVFVTPASNEKDCSPFKSEPDPDERKVADVQFNLGKEQFGRGQFEEALASFRLALNEDVCPLRAIDSIVDAVARVARQHRVPLIDFPQLLRQKCKEEYGHRCLGEEYFLDHVHPDNPTHRQLALWILSSLQENDIVAETALSSSQIDEVNALIEEKIDPVASGVALRNLAKVLHWAGKFSEALPRARDALDLLPDDTASIAVLADCLAQTGDYDAAVVEYERLFQVAPGHVSGYLPYGELLLWQADPAKARVYLLLAITADSPNARAPYFLGIAENELGNSESALEAFQRSHQLDPNYPETMSWIGQLYAEQGNIEQAIRWFRSALEKDSQNADSHFRLGMLLLKRRQVDLAIEQFEAVLRIDPQHADARTNLTIANQIKS